jgi:hypothetical protein
LRQLFVCNIKGKGLIFSLYLLQLRHVREKFANTSS